MPFETRNVEKKHRKEQRKKMVQNVVSLSAIQPHLAKAKEWALLRSKKQIISAFIFCSIAFGGYAGFAYIKENTKELAEGSVGVVTSVLGEELEKTETGSTNILLMGSGGEDHEGGFLTDSLIVVTINYDLKSISMLSIPRDLHVSYSVEGNSRKGKINRIFMEAVNYWKSRVDTQNETIAAASSSIVTKVEEIIGKDIQYSAYIDFQGFVKLIDQLGGIDVTVESRIYDPEYPGPNHSYTTFVLPEGEQNLSGDVALKYVRSRHGTAGGDFGRSYRQKQAIIGLKEKALSTGVLTSPSQIKGLLGIIQENFWTDISWQEMLSLIDFGKDINPETITTGGIKDLTSTTNEWFLYTPPRDLFGGQSVLLPCRVNSKNRWSDIQLYHDLLSNAPELVNTNIVSVYNSTKTPGLASEFKIMLNRFSINLSEIGNDDLREETVIEYDESDERNKVLAEFLGEWYSLPIQPQSTQPKMTPIAIGDAATSTPEPISPSAINIYIGADYEELYRDDALWYRLCL